ncbi:sucrase ferredoxin [Nonomuraea jiangxiensis]|uniref:Sucrase/ferredoxin-like n=1 Tax=Nonomuraea jiangxiensis TaxID=633440 RepID=A0A1G8CAS9_9ACTN|nr:sucrase ferredoxin [Nonomuraea jiangxiensis]SDH42581.1 Sucrase/ferredoxin-like [Nonomuraea jiangxiensis]
MARGCEHPIGCHTGALPTRASATVGARLWLLIEYAGPWPSHLESFELPEKISELVRRALERGIRPQLIRRPGRRTRPREQGIRVLVAYATGQRPWMAGGVVAGPDDLDLDALVAGVVPESCILEDEPVFLVCTHAKRNACCARIGLPLARSLADSLPDRVWETSHVGGDRYAANLVCLPHGIFYGSMSQAAALAAANAYRSGEIILDRYRGRAGIPEPLQAVEHFARVHTGERSVGAVAVESFRSDGDVTKAIVRCGDVRFQVVVEPSALSAPCGTACAETITTYRLVSLDRLAPVRYATPALT